MIKKIIAAAAASMLLLLPAAYAENTNYELNNTENIVINSEEAKINKNNDGYTFENAMDKVASFGKVSGIVESDMAFDLEGEEWIGFQLMAAEPDKRCWSTACYVTIVKAGNIEIQVFNPNAHTGYLANFTYKLPQKERVNVKTGVVPTEKGNYVFIKIGNDVFGVYDETLAIKEEGYFNIEGPLDKITVYNTEADNKAVPGVSVKYDPNENKLIADVDGESNENTVTKWYLSTDEFIYDEKTLYTDVSLLEYVEGAEGSELHINDNEIGLYGMCVTETEGLKVYSNVAYIDPVEYAAAKGYIGRIGYTKASGDKGIFEYNAEDISVYPDEFDEGVFIPLRGIMNGFGCPVEWNDSERTVKITAPQGTGNSTDVIFSVDKQGFLDFKGLMGSGMTEAPKLINDRTYLDIYTTAAILDFENVIYDDATGIIVFTKPELELSDSQLSDLADYLDLAE
ncbi:MAG: stalk domain-containing protein [Clostridia bacterium]|nr:stalk domain-containing protein [Clostridia bacterium]